MSTKTLRANTVTRLKAADISGIGAKVFDGKITSNWIQDLPCICVYTPAEQGEMVGTHNTIAFNSTIDLQIEVVVAQALTAAETVDDIVTAAKNALYQNATWLAQIDWIGNHSLQYVVNGDGEEEIAVGIYTVQVGLAAQNYTVA